VPEAQCLGAHAFAYAFALGAPGDAELLRQSQDHRFAFVSGAPGVELAPPLAVEGDVVMTALKGAQDGDGVVLRVVNPGRDPAELRVAVEAELMRCSLDESPVGPARPVLELRPGEIVTLRIR
jgi:alpha-mannosidase/mannosylglycerate hydrolase